VILRISIVLSKPCGIEPFEGLVFFRGLLLFIVFAGRGGTGTGGGALDGMGVGGGVSGGAGAGVGIDVVFLKL